MIFETFEFKHEREPKKHLKIIVHEWVELDLVLLVSWTSTALQTHPIKTVVTKGNNPFITTTESGISHRYLNRMHRSEAINHIEQSGRGILEIKFQPQSIIAACEALHFQKGPMKADIATIYGKLNCANYGCTVPPLYP